jgi:hypothetical protein
MDEEDEEEDPTDLHTGSAAGEVVYVLRVCIVHVRVRVRVCVCIQEGNRVMMRKETGDVLCILHEKG